MANNRNFFLTLEDMRWIIIMMMMRTLETSNQSIAMKNYDTAHLNRSSFPQGFIFGASASAYQYEGAAWEDGRGPSIWDTYSHKYPGRIEDGSNGDIAVDFYHRYKEDVRIVKEMGLDAYRFSISWSRVLPKGKLSGGVNQLGIQFYHNLMSELLKNGIKPFVTLLHGDLPQALDDYGGFLSSEIVNDFKDYADLCFREYGDQVKHWVTINEPLYYSITGYAMGSGPPARCSEWLHSNCTGGDSGTEPYIVGHNLILAHASAARLYKQKYQASQKGDIGIVIATVWFVPLSKSVEDHDATQRAMDFTMGWFMEPLIRGKYPKVMSQLVKNRLPKFTREQSIMVKRSFDFIGLNYYSASYAANTMLLNSSKFNYVTDWHANLTSERHGIPIGPKIGYVNIYPRGIRGVLHYVKKKYKTQAIYITENGVGEPNNPSLSLEDALVDKTRIDYHYRHLNFLRQAIERDGIKVRGYFVWSLLDNFEWNSGYTVRFGFNFVDYKNGLKRHPKSSAHWFKKFLQK